MERVFHGLVDGPVLIGAVAVGRAERLQLGEVRVKVIMRRLLAGSGRRRRAGRAASRGHRHGAAARDPHVLKQSDHIVAQTLVILI